MNSTAPGPTPNRRGMRTGGNQSQSTRPMSFARPRARDGGRCGFGNWAGTGCGGSHWSRWAKLSSAAPHAPTCGGNGRGMRTGGNQPNRRDQCQSPVLVPVIGLFKWLDGHKMRRKRVGGVVQSCQPPHLMPLRVCRRRAGASAIQ